jgi:hypothetical protein
MISGTDDELDSEADLVRDVVVIVAPRPVFLHENSRRSQRVIFGPDTEEARRVLDVRVHHSMRAVYG